MPEVRVVDTSVVSLIAKRDTRGETYRPHLDGQAIIISFMTLAELLRWPIERQWGERRRQELMRHIERFTIYYADEALCHAWAYRIATARQAGRPLPMADAWIAATALLYQAPLVTHNPGDLRAVPGLRLITET